MADTFFTDLVAELKANSELSSLSVDILPDKADHDESAPYIVLTEISLVAEQNLAGVNNNRSTRIQFEAYSSTKIQSLVIRDAIIDALVGFSGQQINSSTVIQHSSLENTRSSFNHSDKFFIYSVDILFDYLKNT